MTVWIGIDDTDSSKGGCTTYLVYRLVDDLIKEGFEIIGYPRLVRLNPNIPWKTRGNGAVCLRVGIGKGDSIKIGKIEERDLFSYEGSEDDESLDLERIEKVVENRVEDLSFLSDNKTNPGFVISRTQPGREVYEKGVKEIVDLKYIKNTLDSIDAKYKGYKNGRGLIGATASISWVPSDKTFELISYRYKEKWGKKRYVERSSVIDMDSKIKTTFDNYDYKNDKILITPNSPCPVLFGIRGDDPSDLLKAKDMIISEEMIGWMLFETNQGTDDHIQRKRISDIKPFESVLVEGTVDRDPITIPGGHVIFSIRDETSSIDCTAYEPTKEFRKVIRGLVRGDLIDVYGGVREKPFTINIEKIRIKKLIKIKVKIENPICDRCKIHMKSIGKGKGYRCIRCGSMKGENEAIYREIKREIKETFYEVPPCARRHLSKPLKRSL